MGSGLCGAPACTEGSARSSGTPPVPRTRGRRRAPGLERFVARLRRERQRPPARAPTPPRPRRTVEGRPARTLPGRLVGVRQSPPLSVAAVQERTPSSANRCGQRNPGRIHGRTAVLRRPSPVSGPRRRQGHHRGRCDHALSRSRANDDVRPHGLGARRHQGSRAHAAVVGRDSKPWAWGTAPTYRWPTPWSRGSTPLDGCTCQDQRRAREVAGRSG